MSAPSPSASPPRPHLRRVAEGLRWTLIGEVGFAAGQFALLVLLAHLGSEAELGRYSLGMAIVIPLLVITSLQLRPAYVIADDNEDRFDYAHYFTLRVASVPLSVAVAAVWSYLATGDLRTVWIVVAVGVMRGAELFSDIFYAPVQRAEQLRPLGVSRALRGLVLVGSTGTALAVGLDAAISISLGAAASVTLTVAHDLTLARRYVRPRLSVHWRTLRVLALQTAPLGIAGGLLGLSVNMPAYLLEASGGVDEVGRYAAVFSVFYISGVLNAALGGAAVPRLARLFERDRRGFLVLLGRLVLLVAALGAIGWLACQWIGSWYLHLAYGERYVSLLPELQLAALAAAIAGVANLLSQALVIMRRFKTQLGCNVAVLALSVGLATWLIPGNGVYGAIEALMALSIVRLAVYLGIDSWVALRSAPPTPPRRCSDPASTTNPTNSARSARPSRQPAVAASASASA